MHLTRPFWRLAGAAAVSAVLIVVGGTLSPAAFAEPTLPPPAADVFPHVGTFDFDVERYDIDMDYRASDDVSVVATITAVAAAPLDSIRLDFEGLTVDGVSVNGRSASFSREDDAAATLHKLVVTPTTAVDGRFTVVVSYHGAPIVHIDPDNAKEGWMPSGAGVVALGQPVGAMAWFPGNHAVRDKATYDIDVTAPTQTDGRALSVASSGNLTGRTPVGTDRTRWSWDIGVPMSSSSLVLAIGHLDVEESSITLASGRVVPEWSFIDSGLDEGTRAHVENMRSQITPMIDWLETKLGPYPGESLGLIYDRAGVGYALETQDRPFFDGSIYPTILLHELTHMWLGNSVTARTWSEIWLNEGGAVFFESYYTYDALGQGDDPRTIAQDAVTADPPKDWRNPVVGWTSPTQVYSWETYIRASYVYSALMNALGPEGFDEVMKAWTKTHATSTVVTSDFISLASEVSHRDLSRTLTQWLTSDSVPLVPEDILSITPLSSMQTVAGTEPALPATVVPVYASGDGPDAAVTWDVAAVDWSRAGTVTVNGSGDDFFGAPFSTSVVVEIAPAPESAASQGSPTSSGPAVTANLVASRAATARATALPDRLAATGVASPVTALTLASGLLVVGAAVVAGVRRRHRVG